MEDDEPSELAGYEPHERPLRSPHLRTALRIVVILGLVALVLPGVLVSVSTASGTATAACANYVAAAATEAVGYSARFELTGPDGANWYCYAVSFGGDELLVASLGIIPGPVRSAQ